MGQDRPVEPELLVAVEDPGDVDRDAELGEDLQLHPPSRDRQERQRRHQLGITGVGGVGLVVVRRVVVFDRERELPDLLASDLEVVRCPVMAADESLGLLGSVMPLCSLLEYVLSGAAYQRDWRRDANAASAPPAAPERQGRRHPDPGRLAGGAEVANLPPAFAGQRAQTGVGVDGDRRAHQRQHGHVVVAVGIGGAAFEVEPFPDRQRPHRMRLAGAVQDLARPAGR